MEVGEHVKEADLNLCSEVELRDRSLSARVCGLAVDAFAVAFHLGQVLVEDLARTQCGHQVIKLATVVLPVCLRFPGLSLLLPLFFQLVTEIIVTVLTKNVPLNILSCLTVWKQLWLCPKVTSSIHKHL